MPDIDIQAAVAASKTTKKAQGEAKAKKTIYFIKELVETLSPLIPVPINEEAKQIGANIKALLAQKGLPKALKDMTLANLEGAKRRAQAKGKAITCAGIFEKLLSYSLGEEEPNGEQVKALNEAVKFLA